MAVKKNLEVVPSLPKQQLDLEDLLASRLADDLISDVDLGKLTKLAVKHLGTKLKTKFIDWLIADNSYAVPLSEVEAIAIESEKVAA